METNDRETSTFALLLRYRALQTIHRWIYLAQQIPLVGQAIPDRWHRLSVHYRIVIGLALVLGFVQELVKKLLYFALAFVAPTLFFVANQGGDGPPEQMLPFFLWVFTWLNLVLVGIMRSPFSSDSDLEAYELLAIIRMDPARYYRVRILVEPLRNAGFFLLIWLPSFRILDWPWQMAIQLAVLYVALRWIHDLLIGTLLSRTTLLDHKSRSKNILTIAGGLLGVGTAYLPMYVGRVPDLTNFLFAPAFLAGVGVLGLASLSFQERALPYAKIARKQLHVTEFLQDREQAATSIALSGGTVAKKRYVDEVDPAVTEGKAGMAYVHALFFARYRKVLKRPSQIRSLVMVAVVVGLFVLGAMVPELTEQVELELVQLLPLVILFAYLYGSQGKQFTQLLFVNMDRRLLPYSFYRRPDLVLESLGLRFRYLTRLTLPPTLILSVGTLVWSLLYLEARWSSIVIFQLALYIQTLFFNFYYLVIYYTVQPYNEQMENQSIPARLSDTAIYALVMALYWVGNIPLGGYLVIMGVQLVAIVVGVLVTPRLAPRRFRLRS